MEDKEKERGREVSGAGPRRVRERGHSWKWEGAVLLLLFILSTLVVHFKLNLQAHARHHASFHAIITIVLQSRFYSYLIDEKKSERRHWSDS